MGLVELLVGGGIDVCLYLYIGFVIVIYLFEGEMYYCDSFGMEIVIVFGVFNWMSVGKGIVYFECECLE